MMMMRKKTYKPEEDFEFQFEDLISKIQDIKIKELPVKFEKKIFTYLLSTRPRKINSESFLEFLTTEIRNATYSIFNNLISFLVNFINFDATSPEEEALTRGIRVVAKMDLMEMNIARESKYVSPEQEFFAELLLKLKTDTTFQKILKEDKILSKKIRTVLSELKLSKNQIEQIEPFLFKD